MEVKEKVVFGNIESLNSVRKIINDASAALNDPSKVEFSNDVNEVLGGAFGGVLGAGMGAGLVVTVGVGSGAVAMTSGLATLGAIIGGGMFAGIAVAAAPAAVLATIGVYYISQKNKEKLVQVKECLIQEIISKQASIQKSLKDKIDMNEERIDYLSKLLTLLSNSKNELESDILLEK